MDQLARSKSSDRKMFQKYQQILFLKHSCTVTHHTLSLLSKTNDYFGHMERYPDILYEFVELKTMFPIVP
jgi:hypothetical protein